MKIRIAFLQILPGKNTDENLQIGKKACIEAREKGADLALFPEMWSDEYYLPRCTGYHQRGVRALVKHRDTAAE